MVAARGSSGSSTRSRSGTFAGSHWYGGVDEDLLGLGVLVVRDRRACRHHPGGAEALHQLLEQRLDDRPDVLAVVAPRERGQFGDADGGDRFQDDVFGVHVTLFLDETEPRFDADQPGRALLEFCLELSATEPEHAAQLLRTELRLDDLAHLLQGEPEILQGDDPVQPAELVSRVVAIPGGVVDHNAAGAARARRSAAASGAIPARTPRSLRW